MEKIQAPWVGRYGSVVDKIVAEKRGETGSIEAQNSRGKTDYMGKGGRESAMELKVAGNIKDWARYGSF